MTNNQKYEYMDEASIYSDLICIICSEPYKDPVCTPCDHTFCHRCIKQWVETEVLSCPICREVVLTFQLKQASRIVCNMVNRIRVKCLECGQTGLPRGSFDDHIKNECPKSNVSCSSAMINCPWVGQRDQLVDHLKTCIFHLLRPVIDELLDENDKVKDEIPTIEETCIENYLHQTCNMQGMNEYCETSIDELDERLINNESQIENHEFQLIQYPIQITQCMNRLNQIELENQQENNSILQCNQHDIDIKQLTIKLNLIKELSNDYQNSNLEECINKRESNSWIDLSRQQLTDRDMEIVVRHALINKQCKELDLRRNEIRPDGISILTDELSKNSTLEILYLSFNFITDMGVYFLVEAISLNNSILKRLELDSNEITDQGVQYLADMLKTNQTLTCLSLDNNKITNQGMQLISNVLTNSNKRLEKLYINGNKLIDDRCIQLLVMMFKQNRSLKNLNIENCGITKKGKARLQQMVKTKNDFLLNV